MRKQDVEFNLVLKNFMREVKQRFKNRENYIAHDTGLRLKFQPRDEQIAVKVYEGYHTMADPSPKEKTGGAITIVEEED